MLPRVRNVPEDAQQLNFDRRGDESNKRTVPSKFGVIVLSIFSISYLLYLGISIGGSMSVAMCTHVETDGGTAPFTPSIRSDVRANSDGDAAVPEQNGAESAVMNERVMVKEGVEGAGEKYKREEGVPSSMVDADPNVDTTASPHLKGGKDVIASEGVNIKEGERSGGSYRRGENVHATTNRMAPAEGAFTTPEQHIDGKGIGCTLSASGAPQQHEEDLRSQALSEYIIINPEAKLPNQSELERQG